MTALEQLELILRRVIARRQRAFDRGEVAMINFDVQFALQDIADEIALCTTGGQSTVAGETGTEEIVR